MRVYDKNARLLAEIVMLSKTVLIGVNKQVSMGLLKKSLFPDKILYIK